MPATALSRSSSVATLITIRYSSHTSVRRNVPSPDSGIAGRAGQAFTLRSGGGSRGSSCTPLGRSCRAVPELLAPPPPRVRVPQPQSNALCVTRLRASEVSVRGLLRAQLHMSTLRRGPVASRGCRRADVHAYARAARRQALVRDRRGRSVESPLRGERGERADHSYVTRTRAVCAACHAALAR